MTFAFQGGCKVLVTGPWHSSSSGGNNSKSIYNVLIDGVATDTLMVQEGVLRCQVPGKGERTRAIMKLNNLQY